MSFRFPTYWWGAPGVAVRAPERSITTLIEQHVVSPRVVALFWALLQRRASCISVGGHYQGAGKTTTLTALTSFFPTDAELVFARGAVEDFSFVGATPPDKTTIMVPEFSNHTPAYLWGDKAARVFDLRQQGYTFAGTMHADNLEELLAELSAPPVNLSPPIISQSLQLVYFQALFRDSGERRVLSASWIYPAERGPGGLGVKSLAAWDSKQDSWHLFSSPETWEVLARWGGASADALQAEVDRKEAFLSKLVADSVFDYDAVTEQARVFGVS